MRVVVTRAAKQAEELARPLRERGAEVILLPVIEIAPPLDEEPLKRAAARVHEYDWIIFTSANAVAAFAAELSAPAMVQVAAIGAATRQAAEEHGFQVSVTPEKYVAEALVEAFSAEPLGDRRILIPSAAVTRDVVAAELRKRGAHVEVVEAYRNVIPAAAQESAALVFRDPLPEWVTFASSSAVENLLNLVSADVLRRVKIATIGPVTSETVRQRNLIVAAEARVHTAAGLAAAIGLG